MGLFRKKQSQSPRPVSVVLPLAWKEYSWTGRENYSEQAEAFRRVVWVYRAIDVIARAVAGIPWLLYRRGPKGLEEITRHPILSRLRYRANPQTSGNAFLQNLVAFRYLTGDSYALRIPANDKPRELWNLRPDRVSIKTDKQGRILGYEYSIVEKGYKITYSPEEILHLKNFHPKDDFYGLSPISVASTTIDTEIAAKEWNRNLLKNDAKPSGALVVEGTLTDEQYERLKKEINEYSGAQNPGRPLLLEGGLKWQQFSLSPHDMDWLNSRKFNLREIAAIFGVPPELLGDSEQKTYSNYQEARRAFYTETILPLMDEIRDELNFWFFGEDSEYFLDYDRDQIEAIQEDREKLWERAINAWFLSINERRELVDYEAVPGGDVILAPANLIPIAQTTEGGEEE